MKPTLAVLALVCLVGCSKPGIARRTLENSGFKDVQVTGWRPFMAGHDDFWSTGFEAVGPNGKKVSGAVCGGIFKGSTIRFD